MHPLPATKPARFVPLEIIHAILSVDRTKLSNNSKDRMELAFTVMKPERPPPSISPGDESKVIEYAKLRASMPLIEISTKSVPSPFDIIITKQCWVVIEIDSKIENWQFAKENHGVTTKFDSGRDCYLRHVEGGDVQSAGEYIKGDGCRVLYFGVFSRDGKGAPDASELFNFHTEFLTRDIANGEITKRLNVIFDPDIKNEGTKIP
jgi:hypothetical protein